MGAPSKPRRKWGLAFRLVALLLPVVTLLFAGAFTYNFLRSWQNVEAGMDSSARFQAQATIQHMVATLEAVEKIPDMVAALVADHPPTPEELKAYLRSGLAANENIFGATMAFEPHGYDTNRLYYAPYFYRREDGLDCLWLGGANYPYFNLDWYLIPKELGRPVWSEPYFDEGGINLLLSTYSVPVYHLVNGQRQLVGVATADIPLAWLSLLTDNIRILKTGYAFLLSRKGAFIAHPDKNCIMRETIFDQAEEAHDPSLREIGRAMVGGQEGFVRAYSSHLGKVCWIYYAPVSRTGWSLVMVYPEEEFLAELFQQSRDMLVIGIVGLVGLLFLVLWVVRRMIRPINRLTRLAGRIAAGDLAAAGRETAHMEQQAAHMATREYSQLAGAFAGMTQALCKLIGSVRHSSLQVSDTAVEIAASARQLEATAAEQAASTREAGHTSRTMSERARQLGADMNAVAEVAAGTARLAGRGRQRLQEMGANIGLMVQATGGISARLAAISEKAESIGGIVSTINKVADQTNLLSLNAGIEAEKAGELGAGFAVVAREIRRLADQTAESTQDIERVVQEMHGAVNSGVMEVDRFVEQVRLGGQEVAALQRQLSDIIESVQQLTPRFDAINAAMHAQNLGAGQITETMRQLSEAANQIKEALGEFNRVTDQLNGAARELTDQVSQFRVAEEPSNQDKIPDALQE